MINKMEIGSEFWNKFNSANLNNKLQLPKWLQLGQEQRLLLSGRTAIDFIIKDIKAKSEVKSVYLPSYCCFSMIKPFLDNNINIVFYNVKFSKKNGFEYDIDCNKDIDVFFAMNYYGFIDSGMKVYMEEFKNRSIFIIEDITHSLFNAAEGIANYGIASIRKWMSIPSGAIAIKYDDNFARHNTDLKQNYKYVKAKIDAMKLKAKYMESSDDRLKQVFLDKFDESNSILSNQYMGFNIDKISASIINNIDIDRLIRKRKENTEYIYSHLVETEDIRFVYSHISKESCPLFIPIKVNKDKRDLLRNYLILNEIYNPVHWNYDPEGFESKHLREINESIISLVCDQRYGEKEMYYMINKINSFISS